MRRTAGSASVPREALNRPVCGLIRAHRPCRTSSHPASLLLVSRAATAVDNLWTSGCTMRPRPFAARRRSAVKVGLCVGWAGWQVARSAAVWSLCVALVGGCVMSRTRLQPDLGPHVVVVGNHKGGSGKSTFAMHLIVALLKAGKRVASFDLDTQQQTLSRYIENRREWGRHNGLRLKMPKHISIVGAEGDDDYVRVFTRHLPALEHKYDFVVIDTPGNESHLGLVAHGLA